MQRRRADLHLIRDRRNGGAGTRALAAGGPHIRYASVPEQVVQFLTRYLFATLGLIFFNFSRDATPIWLSLWQINWLFGLYLAVNTGNLIHTWYWPRSSRRYLIALLIDVVMVTVCVANDPNTIPPSIAAYIVVVLGNGMRYGLRFFARALAATLIGAGVGLAARYWHLHQTPSQGTLFLALFGAIIVVYAYILMMRIERSRQRSEHRGRTDPLTGLLNRHGLTEAVENWAAEVQWPTRKPIVVFADLDNFKSVNDTYGHAAGDRVLSAVAAMLSENLRADDLVARYGGDEFVVLLADAGLSEAQVIVTRIQSAVETWFRDNNYRCGISIGFAAASAAEWNLERVLQSVDRLLYQSKNQRSARDGLSASTPAPGH